MKKIACFLIILLIGVAINADAKKKARKFYITQDFFHATQALTACADGYHMASLWEIFDTTNLRYDTKLGFTFDTKLGSPLLILDLARLALSGVGFALDLRQTLLLYQVELTVTH
jgi:hypothetical protein